jgi:hypothetical protein
MRAPVFVLPLVRRRLRVGAAARFLGAVENGDASARTLSPRHYSKVPHNANRFMH